MRLTSSVSFLWACLPACLAFLICRKALTWTYALWLAATAAVWGYFHVRVGCGLHL